MKKSSFVGLVLGTISGMLFALGMCMALLPEWNTMRQGIILGCLGLGLGAITTIIWRKMKNKAPIKVSAKGILTVAVGIIGVLMLGIGMCYVILWEKLVIGIIIGAIGILTLISLIPIINGFKD